MNAQSPIISEFETPEQAAAYEVWLAAKVAGSLADPRASIPHDEAMVRARAIIAAERDRQAKNG